MPIANSFKLKDVLEACHYYLKKQEEDLPLNTVL